VPHRAARSSEQTHAVLAVARATGERVSRHTPGRGGGPPEPNTNRGNDPPCHGALRAPRQAERAASSHRCRRRGRLLASEPHNPALKRAQAARSCCQHTHHSQAQCRVRAASSWRTALSPSPLLLRDRQRRRGYALPLSNSCAAAIALCHSTHQLRCMGSRADSYAGEAAGVLH
jgi:hypothetical protein